MFEFDAKFKMDIVENCMFGQHKYHTLVYVVMERHSFFN